MRAARHLSGRRLPLLYDRALARALDPRDVAVELDHLAAAGALVQPVDVLRDQQEFGGASLQLHEREVAGVGLRRSDELAAPGVPIPDEPRVARESGGRGQLARIK